MIITDKYQVLPNETNKHENFTHAIFTKGSRELLGWSNSSVNEVLMVDAHWGMVTCGAQNCHDELIKLVEKLSVDAENEKAFLF